MNVKARQRLPSIKEENIFCIGKQCDQVKRSLSNDVNTYVINTMYRD